MDRHSYDRSLMEMAASLPDGSRRKFIDIVQRETQNPVELFGWNVWLGWLGIDRFIVGDIILGALKLITFGGLGIWLIVDCFLIGNRTREKNFEKVQNIYKFVKFEMTES
ncbi:MAG: TM2 domain-containing protein [Litorimonas sp.]